MPPAVLLVFCLIFIVLVLRLIVPRVASAPAATVEPLSAVADRVREQLRALPETREPTTPEQS
jgi:hypothetical protein